MEDWEKSLPSGYSGNGKDRHICNDPKKPANVKNAVAVFFKMN